MNKDEGFIKDEAPACSVDNNSSLMLVARVLLSDNSCFSEGKISQVSLEVVDYENRVTDNIEKYLKLRAASSHQLEI